MGYICLGLTAIVAGVLLALGHDSPGTWVRSEIVGLLVLAAGAVAVVTGMVVHVVGDDRAHPTRG